MSRHAPWVALAVAAFAVAAIVYTVRGRAAHWAQQAEAEQSTGRRLGWGVVAAVGNAIATVITP